ncbi:scarecrow-like protein 21 [Rhododendron vialii]|uniref:scarecrow-like protein 21 n=1 Tax=Rhododendron vialii TaxID=182163 RepID=UPI00265E2E86|nr:scarecrow-like protein 21 [Rhododendron vialii]
MDSRQFLGYSVTGADFAYSSHPTVPSIPARQFESLKFGSRNSPNSPFSTHFDSQTLTTFSDSQEQHSSTENLSSNSSLETNSYFQQSSPSLGCHQDSRLFHFGGTSFSHDANSGQKAKYTLKELETALMGPDDEEEAKTPSPSLGENKRPQTSSQRSMSQATQSARSEPYSSSKRHKATEEGSSSSLQCVSPDDLKQLLVDCAKALSENRMDDFEKLVDKAQSCVSIGGEPIQRLGAYMVEGLVARKEASGTHIYRTLKCKEPEGKELLSYMQMLYEICPYLKFGYMAANGAIAEACRNEDRIHIVDFQIAQGTQWLTLLQALAARPSGAPHVRITGIDDPVNQYARGDSLEAVGKRLKAISDKFNIPVEFHPVPVFAPDVTKDMLDVRPGEALAVNFPLQLHHTPDESVVVNNPRDGLLRLVKSLSPKVVTLVEQESNTNTAPFLTRFIETLNYYSAMFESIDVTLPRDSKERINVEQHCLARDIVNIIACEGKERVERHELFGKWKSRFTMAGFRQYPLSSYVNSVIRGLLRCYSENYTLVEKDGAMLLGWKDRNLISASAWQ